MKLGRNFNCFCLSLFLSIEGDSQKTVFKLRTYCILVDIFWKGESSSKAIGLTFSYKPFCFVFLFITGFYQVFFWLFYFFFAFLMGPFFYSFTKTCNTEDIVLETDVNIVFIKPR